MFKENSQQFEQSTSPELEKVTSFEELYAFIESQGEIHGTHTTYKSGDLRKIIERVRHGHRPIEWITRNMGIRDTVEKLLVNDRVYLKYTKGSRTGRK